VFTQKQWVEKSHNYQPQITENNYHLEPI